MKKKLIIINGVPGVGKSTVSKELHTSLSKSVWLDGDWCWMMNPWMITEENIKMVERNINYLLRSYFSNSTFDYIISVGSCIEKKSHKGFLKAFKILNMSLQE